MVRVVFVDCGFICKLYVIIVVQAFMNRRC